MHITCLLYVITTNEIIDYCIINYWRKYLCFTILRIFFFYKNASILLFFAKLIRTQKFILPEFVTHYTLIRPIKHYRKCNISIARKIHQKLFTIYGVTYKFLLISKLQNKKVLRLHDRAYCKNVV